MPDEQLLNEMLTRLTRIETKIDTINDHETRIRELEGKSGKRWDSVVTSIISAILVGVVGFAIGKLL